MKKITITRIVLYSLLTLMLIGLLIGGLSWGGVPVLHLGGSFSGSGEGMSEAHEASVPAAGIRDLDIAWASGSITVRPGDTEQIIFSETPDSSYTMGWRISGDELQIQFSSTPISFGGKARKDLTITVPQTWIGGEISIDAASTQVNISDLEFESLDIDGAANEMTLKNCRIQNLDLDGAANRLSMEGSLDQLDSDGASNNLTLILTNHPQEMDLDGVSTRMDLTVPADFGFTVDADGLSFDLETDFEHTRHNKNNVTSGDGACLITVDGVSSRLMIQKAK